jgi:hypothetical protein
MTSDQQCSPVVRYWRKLFRRAEMEIKSKDVTRSARQSGFNRRKGNVEAFSGDRGSIGEKEVLRHFLENGVQMEKGRHGVFSGERGSQWRSQVIVRRLGFKWRKGDTRCFYGEWGSLFGKQESGVQMQ